MLCCLSCRVFNILGCYVACHVVCLTYLDVICLSCCVFDIFGCYVACHVVCLTYWDVMLLVMLCI